VPNAVSGAVRRDRLILVVESTYNKLDSRSIFTWEITVGLYDCCARKPGYRDEPQPQLVGRTRGTYTIETRVPNGVLSRTS
jgi:hypothetical protein